MVAIEKADAPPPDGSTATNTCMVFCVGSRGLNVMGAGTRFEKASMSAALKAFSEPSAEMPSDSRRSIAGSWHQSMEAKLRVRQALTQCSSARLCKELPHGFDLL